MSDAPDLSPQEAVDRWLDRASLDRAAQTIAGYIEHRIKHLQPQPFSEIEQRPLIIKIRDALVWLFSPYL